MADIVFSEHDGGMKPNEGLRLFSNSVFAFVLALRKVTPIFMVGCDAVGK